MAAASLAAVLLAPAAAHATWSIVAVDPETGQVGGINASCVEAPYGTTLLPLALGIVPDVGALAAQAALNQTTRDLAVALLGDGVAPEQVIAMVNATDPGSASRQYGVVTLDSQTATFTGAANQDWAGDAEGVGLTAQGNLLVGPAVVGDALAAFEAERLECPFTLADRLMLALEAGATQGGDDRCSLEQTALAATLQVGYPGDDPDALTLDLRIASQPEGGDNPVVLLRAAYDEWRAANPPDDSHCFGGSTGGDTTGDTGDGDADTTSVGDDSGGGGPNGDGDPNDDGGDDVDDDDGDATSAADGADSGAAPGSGSDSSGGASAGASNGDDGCGCRHARHRSPSAWWALCLLLLLLSRGRARRDR